LASRYIEEGGERSEAEGYKVGLGVVNVRGAIGVGRRAHARSRRFRTPQQPHKKKEEGEEDVGTPPHALEVHGRRTRGRMGFQKHHLTSMILEGPNNGRGGSCGNFRYCNFDVNNLRSPVASHDVSPGKITHIQCENENFYHFQKRVRKEMSGCRKEGARSLTYE